MTKIHIITDSGARFASPHFLQQNPVTVLPNRINIAGKAYREGIDISPEEAMKLIATQSIPPRVIAPSTTEYTDVYTRLLRNHDAIISIHTSRHLTASWDNAKAAAQLLAGHGEIAVIDSQSICAAQGMLVQVAARAIRENLGVEDVINRVRGAVERIYAIYYVDSMDYLLKNRIMSPSHTILGAMLGIKPFIALEEGKLAVVEKVKTRAQAIERLVEFLVEFTEVEDAAILQHKAHISEQSRMLQDRLVVDFPGRHFPYMIYGPSLASFIGTTATGIVVLEEEMEAMDDGFNDDED